MIAREEGALGHPAPRSSPLRLETLMNVILMGPPGAGKGTQARTMAAWLQVPYVPTGDLFRSEIAAGTSLGQEVKGYLDRGELVPDAITIEMVLARLCQPDCREGVLLDGFPRSVAQAEALDKAWAECGKAVDVVLHMKARPEVVLARMANRWVCPKDGTVYNTLTKPPKDDLVCDLCGTPLVQRPDEHMETQRHRLSVYEIETAPILEYYAGRGLVRTIDAEQPMEEVATALRAAIDEVRRAKKI
jgi:adenylate kinase